MPETLREPQSAAGGSSEDSPRYRGALSGANVLGRRRGSVSRLGIVHNVAVGPVEIFLILVVVALVVYVVWRLVVRPRR